MTADTLRKARELYAAAPDHSEIMPPTGRHCIITALCDAGAYNTGAPAMHRAANAYSLVSFNTFHSTEEVLAVFDKAIEAIEGAA